MATGRPSATRSSSVVADSTASSGCAILRAWHGPAIGGVSALAAILACVQHHRASGSSGWSCRSTRRSRRPGIPSRGRPFRSTIVRVETDEGVVGIGSGDTMDGFEAFEHLFIGQDPLAIARHVRALETIDFHAGRYWPLEVALWDIAGQVAGLPVATLFGGATDGIPAYASCGMLLPAGERAESALRLREEGFRRPEDPGRPAPARGGPRGRDARRAPRSATRWRSWSTSTRAGGWPATRRPSLDPAAARAIAARLAELDVLWVEEPLAGTDLRGLAGAARGRPRHPDRRRRDDADVRRDAGRARRRRVRRLPARRRPGRRDAPDAGPSASWPSRATAGSRRTPGRTGSGCSPTCTSRRASAAARSSSSRTTRRAGRRSGATPSSPSRSGPTPTASCASRHGPGSGAALDEAAIARYAA